jgi:hypothetical protein
MEVEVCHVERAVIETRRLSSDSTDSETDACMLVYS